MKKNLERNIFFKRDNGNTIDRQRHKRPLEEAQFVVYSLKTVLFFLLTKVAWLDRSMI